MKLAERAPRMYTFVVAGILTIATFMVSGAEAPHTVTAAASGLPGSTTPSVDPGEAGRGGEMPQRPLESLGPQQSETPEPSLPTQPTSVTPQPSPHKPPKP